MASEVVPNQVKIYLSFYDTSGRQSRLAQLTTGSIDSPVCHFLANEETDKSLFVTGNKDSLHSHACISMLDRARNLLLLTIYSSCLCQHSYIQCFRRHRQRKLGFATKLESWYL